jgi:phosphatase NudJ
MNNSQNDHGEKQFKPNTTVAAVICCDDKFLLVEEIENGKNVFNQPAGHIEVGENLIAAAEREILEETGLALTPQYLNGIYYYHRPELSLYFVRFCFVIELNSFEQGTPQDDEIITTHWLTFNEIKAQSVKLRSPMVLECIEDYLSQKQQGQKIPLSTLKSNI